MLYEREFLLSRIQTFVDDRNDVLAAWEGGSAAFGRADTFSDIDISLLTNGDISVLQELFELYVKESLGVKYLYRIPMPTWHGGAQTFILCENCPPTLLIDITIFTSESKMLFLEPEIHGNSRFIKDTVQLSENIPHLDFIQQKSKIQNRYKSIRDSFELFCGFAEKELQRNKPIEAFAFYQAFILRPLIELLRMKYSPERFDFHSRLLYSDLPEEITVNLEELYFCGSKIHLQKNINEAIAWCRDEIKDFETPKF